MELEELKQKFVEFGLNPDCLVVLTKEWQEETNALIKKAEEMLSKT